MFNTTITIVPQNPALDNLGRHFETGHGLGSPALQFPVHGQTHLGVDLQHRERSFVHHWYAGFQRTAQLGFAVLGEDVVARTGTVHADEGQRQREHLGEHGSRERFDVLGCGGEERVNLLH